MQEPKMCRHAWQLLGMLGNILSRPRHALQRPRSPTSKKNPPTCCLISCEAKGVVYHQASMWDSQDIAKHAEDVASMPRTLQACLGRCKACLGCCKACRGWLRTLPSMPRRCQACLHILGSHISFFHKLSFENSFCFLSILGFQTSFLVSKIENYF